MKSAFPVQLQVFLTDATGGTNPILLDTLDVSDGGWQRLETTFYWDGTTYSGGTSAGVTFAMGDIPASQDFYMAFFALDRSRGSQEWHYPGNVNLANYVPDEYYGATTPTSGVYKLGDRVWNTNTVVGQPAGWLCIRGGDYAGAYGTAPLWSSFGTINFDPSQITGYNFDYDAATLTPGAITTWPSKYGGSDTVAHYALTGTATAHAAGGTGPNGAAYVSGNGSSDLLTEDNQSSQTVAKELYIVAKFDTSGGASGTLWDGGITNTGRIYRPSAGHVEPCCRAPSALRPARIPRFGRSGTLLRMAPMVSLISTGLPFSRSRLTPPRSSTGCLCFPSLAAVTTRRPQLPARSDLLSR